MGQSRPQRPDRPARGKLRGVAARLRRVPALSRGRLRYAALYAVLGGVAALVTSFHVLLFWRRLADQTLLEPLVAARWIAAALVVAAFLQLRRARVSMVWGRRALVLWLAVVVLHFGAVSPEAVHPVAVITPGTAAGVMLAVSALLAGAIAPRLFSRLTGLSARRRAAPRPPFLSRFAVPSRLAFQAGFSPSLTLRPPPA